MQMKFNMQVKRTIHVKLPYANSGSVCKCNSKCKVKLVVGTDLRWGGTDGNGEG